MVSKKDTLKTAGRLTMNLIYATLIKINELQRNTGLPTVAEKLERELWGLCVRLQQGLQWFNRDSGAATNNIQKASKRHSNSLGNHKYHSELGNPLCKRKENSCAL